MEEGNGVTCNSVYLYVFVSFCYFTQTASIMHVLGLFVVFTLNVL